MPLGEALMLLWLRQVRLGCHFGHRRMSRVCLLVGPGLLGASSYASWVPLGTSSYVSCVPLGESSVP